MGDGNFHIIPLMKIEDPEGAGQITAGYEGSKYACSEYSMGHSPVNITMDWCVDHGLNSSSANLLLSCSAKLKTSSILNISLTRTRKPTLTGMQLFRSYSRALLTSAKQVYTATYYG